MAEMRTAFEKTDYRLTRRTPMEPSETHPIGRSQPLFSLHAPLELSSWEGGWNPMQSSGVSGVAWIVAP